MLPPGSRTASSVPAKKPAHCPSSELRLAKRVAKKVKRILPSGGHFLSRILPSSSSYQRVHATDSGGFRGQLAVASGRGAATAAAHELLACVDVLVSIVVFLDGRDVLLFPPSSSSSRSPRSPAAKPNPLHLLAHARGRASTGSGGGGGGDTGSSRALVRCRSASPAHAAEDRRSGAGAGGAGGAGFVVVTGLLACCRDTARLAYTADFWRRLAAVADLPPPHATCGAAALARYYLRSFTGGWVSCSPYTHVSKCGRFREENDCVWCTSLPPPAEGPPSPSSSSASTLSGLRVRWALPIPPVEPSYWEFTVVRHQVGATLEIGLTTGATRGGSGGGHRPPATPPTVMLLSSWSFTHGGGSPWLCVGDRIGMAVYPRSRRVVFYYNGTRTNKGFHRGSAPMGAWPEEEGEGEGEEAEAETGEGRKVTAAAPLYPAAVIGLGDCVAISQKHLPPFMACSA